MPAFRDLLETGAVQPVYQPVLNLENGDVVGYEALARGPAGTGLELPAALFGLARRTGQVARLDGWCQRRAVEGALDGGALDGRLLFVNVEPEGLGDAPDVLEALPEQALARLSVVLEITERAVVSSPSALFDLVLRTRARGWGIALDDIGADPASLAVMPLLDPDVIKLDLRLVQDRPTVETAAILTAVNAHAERTGAVVLAEGIETPAHRAEALAMGARFGQGFGLGRPGRLPADPPPPPDEAVLASRGAYSPPAASPFALVSAARPVRRSSKHLLAALSRHLEDQARALGPAAVVLSTFQHARRFSGASARRFSDMASGAAFVGALGGAMPDAPAAGVRGAALAPDDPLVREWDLVVIGPHFSAALVAADRGDTDVPDAERRFDHVLTFDRGLAVAAACALMSRFRRRA
ncbi:EAL domain-containing protein [Motilibacter sp. E257]|uniref:EAL domain-containing protein n=2 Tax=Motilibacter deserti TaxID=2714956 RepID=A0ABX0GS64_9ACTN|nr:EAL domain-containing protein [Motilibacter deserti]NHC12557.1 EAL domain-containing protein [Motilibacter deserti]